MPFKLPNVEKTSCVCRFLPNLILKLALKVVPVSVLGFAMFAWIPAATGQTVASETTNGTISGTVLTEGTNRPVAQVIVSLKSQSAGISRSVLTDYGGSFEVRGIPAGKYEIAIEEPGYEPLRANEQFDGSPLKLLLHVVSSKLPRVIAKNYTVSVRELKIPDKARNEYRKGLERLAKDELGESLNHFLKATQAFNEYYEAYCYAGMVELKLGRRDAAMESFQEAIDLSGGRFARAQFGMGYLFYVEGNFDEAESVLRRGLEVDANEPNGHTVLGMVLFKLNRLEEAERSAHEALVLNPRFAGAYLVLSDVYGRKAEYHRQLQQLDTYLKLQPTGPDNERIHQERDMALTMIAKSESPE